MSKLKLSKGTGWGLLAVLLLATGAALNEFTVKVNNSLVLRPDFTGFFTNNLANMRGALTNDFATTGALNTESNRINGLVTITDALGTAANSDTTDFATAAQGALADTALQSAAIGTTVQGYSANLTAWSGTPSNAIPRGVAAGSNITTSTNANGVVTINASGGGGGGTSWPVTNAWVELQRIPIIYNTKTNTTVQMTAGNAKSTISEGLPIWTNSITPFSTNSMIIVEFNGHYSCSSTFGVVGAIFRNGGAISVGASTTRIISANVMTPLPTMAVYTNTATNTMTFTMNFGPSSSTTMYINQSPATSGTNLFEEILYSGGSIREVQLPLP